MGKRRSRRRPCEQTPKRGFPQKIFPIKTTGPGPRRPQTPSYTARYGWACTRPPSTVKRDRGVTLPCSACQEAAEAAGI